MAHVMTKRGSMDNCVTYEFMCDTVADMNAIDNQYRTIGTVAIVLQGESDTMEAYIAGSDKQWNSLSTFGATTSNDSGLSIHLCGQDEVDQGLPDIEEPDESTIYLVPAADSSTGNLYDEYIYVDDAWEKFGSGATIDLSSYAPKANPIFTGNIKLTNYSHVGDHASIALGDTVYANDYSAAFGYNTGATGEYTFAAGRNANATGLYAVATGYASQAYGQCSNVHGYYSEGHGDHSTTLGYYTQSYGLCSFTCGNSNYVIKYPNYNANNTYQYGDKVIYLEQGYMCKTSDVTGEFDSSKWFHLDTMSDSLFTVGNGTSNGTRSNALNLDINGNLYIQGRMYIRANEDSTGGNELASKAYVTSQLNDRIPAAPSTNGTYILQATVTNGTPAYSWVSLSSLSGVTF